MIFLLLIDDETDKRKFVIIYEKYRYLMLAAAVEIVQDHHYAEDVVHEAFIKIARNMKRIGDPDSDKTKRYLITITQNTAIDLWRKQKFRRRMHEYIEQKRYFEIPMSTFVEENIVITAMMELPKQYRDVFLMKYAEEMNNKEIARILDIAEVTVRQRISRGKVVLQDIINHMEEN